MSVIQGKVILVTGGANGIGLAHVKELLANGAKGITIVDIKEDAGQKITASLNAEYGSGKVIFVKADVSKESELEGAFQKAVEYFNQFDILINCAGVVNEIDWEKMLSINLLGVIRGTILAAEKYIHQYKSGPEGIIVNTGSVAGVNVISMAPVYSATKAGIIAFSSSFGSSEQYAKYPVRILTICPGATETELFRTAANPELVGRYSKFNRDQIASRPSQEPEHVAKALMAILEKGENGSIWVVEGKEAYQVVIPDREELRLKKIETHNV